MAFEVIILAGGMGTRSADPGIPKIAQVIGGKSLLEWHIDLAIQSGTPDITIVTGHLADAVESLCQSVSYPGRIRIVRESSPKGTVNALTKGAMESKYENILVLLGDIWVSFPAMEFMDAFDESKKGLGVIVHPSTHPHDSDLVFLSHDGRVEFSRKGAHNAVAPNMASAGVFAVTRDFLMNNSVQRDVGSDLIPLAVSVGELFVYVSSHYFKDTGTPMRLTNAQIDHTSGAFARRGEMRKRSAILLDRDGVINAVKPEVYRPEDYFLLPGVAEGIKVANDLGIPVFVVTNQPGIAKGLMNFNTHEMIRAEMDQQLSMSGAFVDDYYFCPHHPDAGFPEEIADLKVTCDCRKPEPGMGIAIAAHHGIDLESSFVVGDTLRDKGLADRIGARFIHVTQTCEISGDHICVGNSPKAIEMAIAALTC
jgi:mannose-1-phosphate guanylyltransferase/phosphomannomutase